MESSLPHFIFALTIQQKITLATTQRKPKRENDDGKMSNSDETAEKTHHQIEFGMHRTTFCIRNSRHRIEMPLTLHIYPPNSTEKGTLIIL